MNDNYGVTFGPFRLVASQRLLLEGDKAVRLGGRAIDLLIALVDQAGQLVSKDALMSRVWPDTVVEEASLRVHIGALRKALGDGQGGQRFITNVPGRGYCFVGEVERFDLERAEEAAPAIATPHNLPVSLTRMIGQGHAVSSISTALSERRLVTLVGPGGIGKTTTALAVAESCLSSYADGVHFVDLAVIRDGRLLPASVASALTQSLSSDAPIEGLIDKLRDKRMLLVFDNCEQVVDAAAAAAVQLLKGCSGLRILATSREPLRAEGEVVHRLASLGLPPRTNRLATAAEAMAWPAIQLFVERSSASYDGFELGDDDAEDAAEICRRLDGMPLAIELAAVRIGFFGLKGLLARLNDSLRILSSGHRTALPRHQTLRALLDWSFDLLPPPEQKVLQRLSVFTGPFTLDAAVDVVTDRDGLQPDVVLEHVVDLALKSLVTTDFNGDSMRYRLLDTTRAYATEKLVASGDLPESMRRYATWLNSRFDKAVTDWDAIQRSQWFTTHAHLLDGVRFVLDWAFGPGNEPLIGAHLLDAALPLAQRQSSVDEYCSRLSKALAQLSKIEARDIRLEMRLNTALGSFLGQAHGPSSELEAVSKAALEAAKALGLQEHGIETVSGLWVGHFGRGDYPTALDCVNRLGELTATASDESGMVSIDRMMAQTRHMLGHHAQARELASRVLSSSAPNKPLGNSPLLPFDRRVSMGIVLARILWLEGNSSAATEEANRALKYAESDIGFAICHVLAFAACPIAIWRGDRQRAQELTRRLREESLRLSLQHWQSWADNLDELLSGGAHFHVAASDHKQWDSLAALGAPSLNPETRRRVDAGVVGWCAPEVLRLQAEHLARSHEANLAAHAEAERLLERSLTLAEQQGALAWSLRAATTLGELCRNDGRKVDAARRLSSICGRFDQEKDNLDVAKARELLRRLEMTS
jgi:predicted ATPase/DNA-binding winged helix-turn-helix (wHTH) protein